MNSGKHQSQQSRNEPVRYKIVNSWLCELYEVGDLFEVDRHFIRPPGDKPLCIHLAEALSQKNGLITSHRVAISDMSFMCSGCQDRAHVTVNLVQPQKLPLELSWLADSLHEFSFFRLLPQYIVEDLYDSLKIVHISKGERIIERGAPGEALYIVVSGELSVLAGESDTIVSTLGVGAVLGEMSILSGNSCNASVEASKECRLLTIEASLFKKLLTQYPRIERYFYQLLAHRLNKMNMHSAQSEHREIHGTLAEWPLADLLQTINMNHKSGTLEFQFHFGKGNLHFQYGNITGANYKKLQNLDAFFHFFREEEGSFNFIPEPLDLTIPILGDFMTLMMEGLVRADEATSDMPS
jgi:CRP/FNR family cyclic AMP-dependent transcriptional regulator